MFIAVQKLKKAKHMLKEFNITAFGDISGAYYSSIQELKNFQEALQRDPFNPEVMEKEKIARQKKQLAASNYQSLLSHKAKFEWNQGGDENTKVFHRSLKVKREQSTVYAIKNASGKWVDEAEEVTKAFVYFYEELLGTDMVGKRIVNAKIAQEGTTVTESQRDFLLRPYTEDEVKQALFSIPDSKAPGPDGFNNTFFKKTWHIVGKDITLAIISFLNSGENLKEINNTTLTLVPKVKCPDTVADF
ncbi:uncharacterized protein LOC133799995 [Humulus lupulus]|uniref:uncharacterized protein LOC133799995 n=1 Tax=Humulus lupulus TaxID=3486 RepID=UPI002B413720|nr:uncharacterized protein LOC133799995 [Humulus lupulus]